MKRLLGILVVTAVALGFASKASASTITWYINATLNCGGCSVVGSFDFDTVTLQTTGVFDVTISGTASADYHYVNTNVGDADNYRNLGLYGDPQVDFNNSGFSKFLDLYLSAPITAGSTFITLGNSAGPAVACPGCATLTGDIQTTNPVGTQVSAVPEPATLSLLGLGLVGLSARVRSRKSRG